MNGHFELRLDAPSAWRRAGLSATRWSRLPSALVSDLASGMAERSGRWRG
jgi:hypothetical protein